MPVHRSAGARNRRRSYDVGSQMLRAASRLVKPSSMRGGWILVLLALTTMASAAPRSARKTPAKANDRSEKNDKDTKTTGEKGEKGEKSEKSAKPAERAAEERPRTPGPDDAKAVAILGRIVAGADTAARKAAVAELAEIAPSTIEAIAEWLRREQRADVA